MTISTRVGRFSDGQATNDATEETRIGRFSDGQAMFGERHESTVVGRFSIGQELLAETPDHLRIGSFADGVSEARLSLTLDRGAETIDELPEARGQVAMPL